MDSRRAYRAEECRRWQKQIKQELAEIPEEAEPVLRRQFVEISELAYELELDLPHEERLAVLCMRSLSRLVEVAWFGEVLINERKDRFVPLVGITCASSLNETWGHFIIQRKNIRENMKWLETGVYLLPVGMFTAAIFPAWKTGTLRRKLIPQCPILPIASYKEYIERLK